MHIAIAILSGLAASGVPMEDPVPFGPSDVFGTFSASAMAVLPWIAAGLTAAIGLYFAVLGIRKGLSWFFSIVRKA